MAAATDSCPASSCEVAANPAMPMATSERRRALRLRLWHRTVRTTGSHSHVAHADCMVLESRAARACADASRIKLQSTS